MFVGSHEAAYFYFYIYHPASCILISLLIHHFILTTPKPPCQQRHVIFPYLRLKRLPLNTTPSSSSFAHSFLSDPGEPGVRSMGPDVRHWVQHHVETWLMWLWLMKIPTQYQLIMPIGQFKTMWHCSDTNWWPTTMNNYRGPALRRHIWVKSWGTLKRHCQGAHFIQAHRFKGAHFIQIHCFKGAQLTLE